MVGRVGRRGNHQGSISPRADGSGEARIALEDGQVMSFSGIARAAAVWRLSGALHKRGSG